MLGNPANLPATHPPANNAIRLEITNQIRDPVPKPSNGFTSLTGSIVDSPIPIPNNPNKSETAKAVSAPAIIAPQLILEIRLVK